jgi:hypothetical protein
MWILIIIMILHMRSRYRLRYIIRIPLNGISRLARVRGNGLMYLSRWRIWGLNMERRNGLRYLGGRSRRTVWKTGISRLNRTRKHRLRLRCRNRI